MFVWVSEQGEDTDSQHVIITEVDHSVPNFSHSEASDEGVS